MNLHVYFANDALTALTNFAKHAKQRKFKHEQNTKTISKTYKNWHQNQKLFLLSNMVIHCILQ